MAGLLSICVCVCVCDLTHGSSLRTLRVARRRLCRWRERAISMATGHQQHSLTAVIMAEPRTETVKQAPKRVFINNIDSYASKRIAKVKTCQN